MYLMEVKEEVDRVIEEYTECRCQLGLKKMASGTIPGPLISFKGSCPKNGAQVIFERFFIFGSVNKFLMISLINYYECLL